MTRVRRNRPTWCRGAALAARVLAAVGAGYACTAAVVALVARALPLTFGIARSEAVVVAAMTGFILYLMVLLWGFAEPRQGRVWGMLLGGTALCRGILLWLAPLGVA